MHSFNPAIGKTFSVILAKVQSIAPLLPTFKEFSAGVVEIYSLLRQQLLTKRALLCVESVVGARV